jgi:plastocyanin
VRQEASVGWAATRRAIVLAAAASLLAVVGPQPVRGADETTAWDYRTIFVVWDETAQDWRADWNDGPSTVGLEAVLDAEGAVGWDLVEVTHERFDDVIAGGTASQEARRLRLIFKRPGTAAVAVDPSVTISGFSFQPASLEVGVGTTVRWDNQDPAAHTVTASDGAFDSGSLASGEAFEHTFDTAGTFAYACAIHPSMLGTVIVS